jgi:NADH-quinone oxidoreductase subunit L
VFERAGASGSEAAAGAAAHGEAFGLEIALMLAALGVVIAAILLARRFYRTHPEIPKRLAGSFPRLATVLENKYYVDELYDRIAVRPFLTACKAFHGFDVRIVDGVVNGVRHLTVGLSYVSRFFDQFVVDGLVNATAYIARGLSLTFRRMQTGLVQGYLSIFVFGIFLFVSFYLFWHR